jgi:(1->4)-alpha-D-glucan 1-alpha-D-glucosylmutase
MSDLRCTYRLQLAGDFGFARARELVPYLRELGVSHLYLPPSFQARPGSTHGYDVVDPTRISRELGGEEEFFALCSAARAAGLGVILDIVPNHMAADEANRYWMERREQFFDLDPRTGRHRRFFDIDHLAGVRQEDPEVFDETHRLALSLVADGVVDGLRIDHPDGLADPAGYLRRLADRGVSHVWVEKILDHGEQLRDWPVDGTVGYEFLNDVQGLFVDAAAERSLTALWEEVSGDARPFADFAHEAKLEQAHGPFVAECERLRAVAGRPIHDVEGALASLPVYRTYIRDGRVEPADSEVLREAALEWLVDMPEEFITRFQQTSPPIMAKGVEDTAFYRYARLLALNDVGGDPGRFGVSIEDFHAANRIRAQRFPRNLLITQTHDTKRSGDVRARIGALSTMPDGWREFASRWLDAIEGPDRVERYLLLQTVVGAWPIDAERLAAYMEKALRERKVTTNWIEPDEQHEARVARACRRLLADERFVGELEALLSDLAITGDRHAIAQLLLKLTVPGVPDIYNGDELEALFLVDPDNRRPVDWGMRQAALDEIRAGAPPRRETAKLWLIVRALELRAERPQAFAGSYEPVPAPEGVCAFRRGDDVLVAVATRAGWPDSPPMPDGDWIDVLADGLDWNRHGLALRARAAR